jgi:hypothetical protein
MYTKYTHSSRGQSARHDQICNRLESKEEIKHLSFGCILVAFCFNTSLHTNENETSPNCHVTFKWIIVFLYSCLNFKVHGVVCVFGRAHRWVGGVMLLRRSMAAVAARIERVTRSLVGATFAVAFAFVFAFAVAFVVGALS